MLLTQLTGARADGLISSFAGICWCLLESHEPLLEEGKETLCCSGKEHKGDIEGLTPIGVG